MLTLEDAGGSVHRTSLYISLQPPINLQLFQNLRKALTYKNTEEQTVDESNKILRI